MKNSLITLVAAMLTTISKSPIFRNNKLVPAWADALNRQDWDAADRLHGRIRVLYGSLSAVENPPVTPEEAAQYEKITGKKCYRPNITFTSLKVEMVLDIVQAMAYIRDEYELMDALDDLHKAAIKASRLGISIDITEEKPVQKTYHRSSNDDIVSFALSA